MRFTLVASLLAATAFAAPAPEVEERGFGCILPFQAQSIINQYISILQNQTYQGKTPAQTAAQIIAPNYVEYSDSILSLEGQPVSLQYLDLDRAVTA